MRSRHGNVLIMAGVSAIAITGFMTLSVDYGRVLFARNELQSAVDAAARAGAASLSQGPTAVQDSVIAIASENSTSGTSVSVDRNNDIEFGTWDPETKSFLPLPSDQRLSATAVRVTARRSAATQTAIPVLWGFLIGQSSVDVRAVSIATRGRIVKTTIEADACPWLAGMPSGSIVAKTGTNPQNSVAPEQSPEQVTGLAVSSGRRIAFRQVTGTTSWASGSAGSYGPDGATSIRMMTQTSANGIGQTSAPLQSLVGIFVDDRQPSTFSAAAAADFSTSTSRDFVTLAPQLKQVFFIGDGINSAGDLQNFVVPTGATRLYLGLMDECGYWWDNNGIVETTVIDDMVQTVK